MDLIKLVILGDVGVGKTCLLITYTTNNFLDKYSPTIFEEYLADVYVSNKPLTLNFWDFGGEIENLGIKLKNLSWTKKNIVLLCFSIVDPNSFQNVREKWFPQLKHHCPTAKVILVGTKKDLRDDYSILDILRRNDQKPVTQDQAIALKKSINAVNYIGTLN